MARLRRNPTQVKDVMPSKTKSAKPARAKTAVPTEIQGVEPAQVKSSVPTEIKKVGVLGGGHVGSGCAQALALAGFHVTVQDLHQELIDKCLETIIDGRYGLKRGVELEKISEEQMEQALDNLHFTLRVEFLRDVDLVLECVPEDANLKKRVFANAERAIKPRAIFATNTYGFPIDGLSQTVKRKDRFIGMHWFSPTSIMKLVELVYTRDTAEETIRAVEDVCQRAGKVGIRVRDNPHKYGFVAYRIYLAAIREAEQVIEEGIASREDIDKAMVLGFNWPVGPLSMMKYHERGWEER